MKTYIVCLLLLFTTIAWADSLEVKINPPEPIANEPFEIEFIVESKDGEDPMISFDPSGFEVISRSQGAVSTRTSYINGKMSFSRTISIKYEMLAKNWGQVYLRNIKAEIGGNTLKHKNMIIRILRLPRKSRDFFVKAEVAKEELYVGESLVVRYFLYNKANKPLRTYDVKKFPKLDKFLKRFHQEKAVPERVQINGEMYVRRIIYTAQLFAESPGKFKIDPISMRLAYSDRGRNSLNNFGFGLRLGRTKTKTVISEAIELKVIPLPANNIPKGFTGLVGKHNFKLVTSKKKYLSNEPIEMQLIIDGQGALELFEAPKLFVSDLIEEFETTTDLKINANFTAQKKFEYTYLGRGSVKLDEFIYPLSYFDVETGQYVTENLKLGPLEVVAIGNVNPPKKVKSSSVESGSSTTAIQQSPISYIEKSVSFEPIFKGINSFIYYSKHLFYLVGISLLLLLSFFTFKQSMKLKKKDKTVFEEIYASGVTYSSLFKVLGLIGNKETMEDNIANSRLSDDCKQYFCELIKTVNSKFAKNSENKKFKIKKKYFQEVESYIKKNDSEYI